MAQRSYVCWAALLIVSISVCHGRVLFQADATASAVDVVSTTAPAQDTSSDLDDQLVTRRFNLAPVAGVISCAPFNIVLRPVAEGDSELSDTVYKAQLVAEASVRDAVSMTIVEDLLYISANDSFTTTQVINLEVYLPASNLSEVHSTGVGSVILGSGFSSTNLTLESVGLGQVVATGLNVSYLNLRTTRGAQVFAAGDIQDVNVTARGTGRVVVSGVTGTVVVDLDDLAQAWISPESDDVVISGKTSGLSAVRYTQGTCEIQPVNIFSWSGWFSAGSFSVGTCTQVDVDSLPKARPRWTCGLRLEGDISCPVKRRAGKPTKRENGVESSGAATTNTSSGVVVQASAGPPGEGNFSMTKVGDGDELQVSFDLGPLHKVHSSYIIASAPCRTNTSALAIVP